MANKPKQGSGNQHDQISGGEHARGGEGGYQGQHGMGPQQGQGHQGYSARISDRGSQGGAREGGSGQELGSHGGRRREHQNPGSKAKGRGDGGKHDKR